MNTSSPVKHGVVTVKGRVKGGRGKDAWAEAPASDATATTRLSNPVIVIEPARPPGEGRYVALGFSQATRQRKKKVAQRPPCTHTPQASRNPTPCSSGATGMDWNHPWLCSDWGRWGLQTQQQTRASRVPGAGTVCCTRAVTSTGRRPRPSLPVPVTPQAYHRRRSAVFDVAVCGLSLLSALTVVPLLMQAGLGAASDCTPTCYMTLSDTAMGGGF
jgi:hypothetical protein